MKVNLVFAEEWTTEAVEKKETENITLTENWILTKRYFTKSYLINSTCNKGEEKYKRENENFR